MQTICLTRAQARTFLLRHHGLIGEHRFRGKEGALAYIRQCGCIQFDPIDVCGKNAELALQSRVAGFTRDMLDTLLYKDRALVDFFDKNLAIFPVEDWPYFARERARNHTRGRSRAEVDRVAEVILRRLETEECLCARDLGMEEKVDWYWSPSTLGRAVLETLYFRGVLCVHHKKGTNKYYAPASRHIPGHLLSAPDPHETLSDFHKWQTLRRMGAVGLLWNKASDAFLCMPEYKTAQRNAAFAALIAEGALCEVRVEGLDAPLYARASETALLREVAGGAEYAPRMELIAPLDCFMWDRKLIRALFDFAYTWEIYTPAAKRQYGYYVLPLLRGDRLAGRVEAVADRTAGCLRVKGVWWEGRAYPGELRRCLSRFARFNGVRGAEGLLSVPRPAAGSEA